MSSRITRTLTAALVLCGFVASAQADLLRITPEGLTPAEVDALGNKHPVIIGPDAFRITFHGGGPAELVDPLLLIVATPTADAAIPTLTFSDSDPAFPSFSVGTSDTDYFGGSWDADGFVNGVYDQTAAGADGKTTVYEFIGLSPDGVDSEHWVNWNMYSGLDSWDLRVFQLSFSPDAFAKGDWVELSATGLTGGSFIVGYGCTSIIGVLLDPAARCLNEGATQSTPFTFAGMVRVPEPSTLWLIGTGLLALGAISRRRKSV